MINHNTYSTVKERVRQGGVTETDIHRNGVRDSDSDRNKYRERDRDRDRVNEIESIGIVETKC